MSVNKRHRDDFRGASIRGSLRDRGRRYSSHVVARRESARGVDAAIRRPSLAAVVERGSWGSRWEFLLSCVGLSVGIGNVWRFPYLAHQNGGGAFLIPYLIMLVLIGKPMYFLELAVGQFGGVGPVALWNCCPIMKGVGYAMVTVSLIVCIYYNVIMSYTIHYMIASFTSVVPWSVCDPAWADLTSCYIPGSGNISNLLAAANSSNITIVANSSNLTNTTGRVRETASLQYWERHVLKLSDGIEHIGPIKWDLALCLLVSWIIVVLCLIKGIKTSGKVVYFAATFPYVILIILLVTGLLQEGALDGVKYFLMPQWDQLLNIKVWQAAAGQMFFSLSVSMGGLIMYSSYNDFNNNVYRDAVVVSVLDTLTSIISGLVAFSILGATAHDLQMNIDDVVKEGPGLAFVAYPEALLRLPIPQLWSVLFFLMLFILGLDSEFALLENVITSISDEFPKLRKHKLAFCIGTAIFCYLVGLTCVTHGGSYVLTLMDTYGGSMAVVCIAIYECIGLLWIYGCNRLCSDLAFMLGSKPGLYWRFTWTICAPLILFFILVFSLYQYKPLTYESYDYPDWADMVGWGLCLFSVLQIPIGAVVVVALQKGSFWTRIKKSAQPTEEWGPSDSNLREKWAENWKKKKNPKQTIELTAMSSESAVTSPTSPPPTIQLNHVIISAVANGDNKPKEYL